MSKTILYFHIHYIVSSDGENQVLWFDVLEYSVWVEGENTILLIRENRWWKWALWTISQVLEYSESGQSKRHYLLSFQKTEYFESSLFQPTPPVWPTSTTRQSVINIRTLSQGHWSHHKSVFLFLINEVSVQANSSCLVQTGY
jgi:hypothetical protein